MDPNPPTTADFAYDATGALDRKLAEMQRQIADLEQSVTKLTQIADYMADWATEVNRALVGRLR